MMRQGVSLSNAEPGCPTLVLIEMYGPNFPYYVSCREHYCADKNK